MRTGYLSFAIVTLMLAANLPAAADDSGHWRGLAALVVTDQKTVKVDDGTDHVVIVSEQDGAIQNADGNSFLDKARYQVVSVVDTGVIRGGYKTFTEADGSKVFAKYTVTEFKLPEVNGTLSSQVAQTSTKASPATASSITSASVTGRHGTNLLVNTRFQR
jgi:hypothetical protein